MSYPIIDKDGVQIGEYTREEMVALTMKDMANKRQKADVVIAAKARKELEADAQKELDKLNKTVRKKENSMDDSVKIRLFRLIMKALPTFPMYLTKTELYVRGSDGDYSIKITKKKERVSELDGARAEDTENKDGEN